MVPWPPARNTAARAPKNALWLASKPASLRQPRVAAAFALLLAAAKSWEPPSRARRAGQ